MRNIILILSIYHAHAIPTILVSSTNGKIEFYYPTLNFATTDYNVPNVTATTVSVLLGNRIFLIGVKLQPNSNSEYSKLVVIYDPSTKTYSTGPPMNSARRLHAASIINDTIIVCGGDSSSSLIPLGTC